MLTRLKHMNSLSTVMFRTSYTSWGVPSLPARITTLVIHSDALERDTDLRELGRLPYLTTLCIGPAIYEAEGLQHISGLTRLQASRPVGSLAHLGATLKHLKINDYKNVRNMHMLTNLETLEVVQNVPVDFFKINGQLLLEQMCLDSAYANPLCESPGAWDLAPKTLTRLSMFCTSDKMGMLPTSIAHLQITNTREEDVIQAARSLPELRRLDLEIFMSRYTYPHFTNIRNILRHVSSLTNLQCLGLLITGGKMRMSDLCDAVQRMPEVALALTKGMHLNFIASKNEFQGLFDDLSHIRPTWATPALAGPAEVSLQHAVVEDA